MVRDTQVFCQPNTQDGIVYLKLRSLKLVEMAKSSAAGSSVQKADRKHGSKDAEKKKKSKRTGDITEQVRAMGGDESDLALLNGAKDELLVQGAQAVDVCIYSSSEATHLELYFAA